MKGLLSAFLVAPLIAMIALLPIAAVAKDKEIATKVVCFGDSITKRGYPEIVGKSLAVETVNSGVAGHSSAQGLRRIQKDVLDHKPQVVVIFFGTNDARVDSERVHVTARDYGKNLDEMVKACEKIGAKVVICTPPPVDEKSTTPAMNPIYMRRREVSPSSGVAIGKKL